LLLESRHEGQAPDIDGVVYLNEGKAYLTQDAPLPGPGDMVKAEITDAYAYDLVGRIVE
jgi:ribosomal protein S12 methylthiotransferase